jgi:hypothetical protein
MKAALQFIVCLVIVLFVGKELVWFFASDETRIRWRIEEMVEGFNDASLASASAALHPDWTVEDNTRVTRGLLKDGLRSVFFTEKQPETRAFALEAEVLPETWSISVAEEAATANFELAMYRLESDTRELEWRVRLNNTLSDDPELGWTIVRTGYESLEGDSP